MRSRLSFYSVILLLGLAVVSALVLTMNPFNGGPASPPPAAQRVSATISSVANGDNSPASNSPATSTPSGNGPQPGGGLDGGNHGHYSDDFPGIGSNGTTTTTTGTIYSQDE